MRVNDVFTSQSGSKSDGYGYNAINNFVTQVPVIMETIINPIAKTHLPIQHLVTTTENTLSEKPSTCFTFTLTLSSRSPERLDESTQKKGK